MFSYHSIKLTVVHDLQPTWVDIQQKMSEKAPQKVNGQRLISLEDLYPAHTWVTQFSKLQILFEHGIHLKLSTVV